MQKRNYGDTDKLIYFLSSIANGCCKRRSMYNGGVLRCVLLQAVGCMSSVEGVTSK